MKGDIQLHDRSGIEAPRQKLPEVAIVGRPNVGKSSLFNRLAGRRISIVDPTSGVTRDRVSVELRHGGRDFELVDTGGIGMTDVEEIRHQVEHHIELAIERASIIVFVVDIREGVMPLDNLVAERLRHVQKPVLLVANKVDSPSLEPQKGEFFKLGFGEALSVSALQGEGRSQLLEEITALLPKTAVEVGLPCPYMRLAVVGRRNVGKSTLINTLAGEERMIVSEIPGTTRDSVDIRFEVAGPLPKVAGPLPSGGALPQERKVFLAIDTPGVRKRRKTEGTLDFYSLERAMGSIRRADVVLFLLDASEAVAQVDKKLGSYIAEQYKPCVLVINKWDLATGHEPKEFEKYLRAHLPGLAYAPVSCISARNGTNVAETIALAEELFEQSRTRVPTSELNRVVQEAFLASPPKAKAGRRGKIYFATQIEVSPPTFVLFVNYPDLFDPHYERYLSNRLHDALPFSEVPLKFYFRMRKRGA
jgi:GTP-binding protein